MIIKSIEINNFRSYYRDNRFEFSNGLTLIVGDNGDGKTTFFEALQWLFNTTSTTPSLTDLSEMRRSEMEIGDSATVCVSMKFEHSGDKIIEKKFEVVKTKEDEFRTQAFEFNGYEDKKTGREPVDGRSLVTRCFDAFLQKFSMFKGESQLNVFNDPTALKQLVAKFSDLKSFEDYVAYVEEFERKSDRAYKKEAKRDDNISGQVNQLDNQLIEVNRLIQHKSQEIKDCEKSANYYRSKIEDLEKCRDISEQYNEVKQRFKAKSSQDIEIKGWMKTMDFNIFLLDKLWILFAFPQVLKDFHDKSAAFSRLKREQNEQFIKEQGKKEGKIEALNTFTELVNGTSRLPWYLPNQETMEEMIHDHICKVCNREAPEGSDAYKFMCEKLDEYKREALAKVEAKKDSAEAEAVLFEHSYIEEIHNVSLNLGGFNEADIAGKSNEIRGFIDLMNKRKMKLEEVEKSIVEIQDDIDRILIESGNLSEDVLDKNYSDFKGFMSKQGDEEKRLVVLKGELDELKRKQDYIKQQLDSLSPNVGQAKLYKRVHIAFEKIKNAFIGAKEKNLSMFLEDLEKKANEYLVRLNTNDFHGIVKLVRTADDSAVIKLFSSNGTEVKKPSGSQETTMYISVLFAISDLTTLKREENYPLIFDAATSSFGDTKESDFYNIIGGLDKQCIIVTKDFLNKGILKQEEVTKLNCSVYRIKKADGHDSRNLATIRTNVIKIK